MKKVIILSALALGFASCTDKFPELNSNPYGINEEIQKTVPGGKEEISALGDWQAYNQENGWQMTMDMLGYMSGFNAATGFIDDYPAFNPRSGWNDYSYDDTYGEHLYPNYIKIKAKTKGDFKTFAFSTASIARVVMTLRLTDAYGPLPYSQIDGVKTIVPYDSQRDIYFAMLEELKAASEALDLMPPSESVKYSIYDDIYKADTKMWAKYARSIMLRMAVRMAKQEPAKAKEYAEYAVSKGVISTNAESAKKPTIDNPAYKMAISWSDSRSCADIVEYMKAFGDARTSKYFTPVASRGGIAFGHRNGSTKNIKASGEAPNYSSPNLQKNTPITIINAAEVKFLMAEAVINGWNMGGANAKELYEEGIKLSHEEWKADIKADYLTNTNTRGAFTDDKLPQDNAPTFSSQITVSWDDAAGDKEKQLSKIITQKWIAMYPFNTIEAWTEWRRTGYPNLMNTLNNKSAGVVKDITQENGKDRGGMRRLKFSNKDKQADPKNVKAAVALLEGPDTHATDLWWAK